jgi:Zn-dependent protease with chaperone function
MSKQGGNKKFRKLGDMLKVGGSLSLAYAPYIAFMYNAAGTTGVMRTMAVIGGMFAALRTPYVQEVPLLLAKAFTRTLMARKVSKAPDDLKEVINRLSEKMDMKPPRSYTFSKGSPHNAFALVNEIYIGDELREDLNEKEMEFVIAHELAHLKTKDMGETYLHLPPHIDAIFNMFSTITDKMIGTPLYAANMLLVGASFLYFKGQAFLQNFSTRTM